MDAPRLSPTDLSLLRLPASVRLAAALAVSALLWGLVWAVIA